MPLTATDLLLGFVLPAVFAGGTLAVCSRAAKDSALGRLGPSLGLVGGFLLGYFLLKLGPVAPDRHWQWMPYAMLLPLVLGPVSVAPGVTWLERILVYALIAAVAGWWLVPTWEDLEPSRGRHLLVWGAGVVVLAGLLEPLSRRLSGTVLATVYFLTMVFAGGVLVFSGSLRFGQIAGAGAGAFLGLAVASRFRPGGGSLPGLAVGFVLLAAGMLLVGRVSSFSKVPLASYLLVSMAPVSLWTTALGPVSRWKGGKRFLAAVSLPAVIDLVGLILAGLAVA